MGTIEIRPTTFSNILVFRSPQSSSPQSLTLRQAEAAFLLTSATGSAVKALASAAADSKALAAAMAQQKARVADADKEAATALSDVKAALSPKKK